MSENPLLLVGGLIAAVVAILWFISWGFGWFHVPNEYGIAAAILLAINPNPSD